MQVIAHEDADGVCSASLMRMIETSSKVFFSKPCGLARDLDQVDTRTELAILDIALCELTKRLLVNRLSRWRGRVIYIDHHPETAASFSGCPNVEVISGDVSTAELTFAHFRSKLRRDAERVMLMGAIGDYADLTPLCTDLLHRWDKRSVFLQAGFLNGALEITRHDHEFHRQVVGLLAGYGLPSNDARIVDLAVKASGLEEDFRRRVERNTQRLGRIGVAGDLDGPAGKGATYAAAASGVSIGAYFDKDMKRGIADISFRVVDGSIDLNRILRRVAPPLGGSGGGHPQACGARLPLEKLDQLFAAINMEISAGTD